MGCKGSFHFLLLLAWPSGSFFRVWSCLCEKSIVITSDYNRLTFLKKGGGMREGSSKKKLVVLFILWSWRYWLLLVMRRFCWLSVFVLRFLIPWAVSVALQWPLSGNHNTSGWGARCFVISRRQWMMESLKKVEWIWNLLRLKLGWTVWFGLRIRTETSKIRLPFYYIYILCLTYLFTHLLTSSNGLRCMRVRAFVHVRRREGECGFICLHSLALQSLN